MELKVLIKKGESGLYVARVPALKGCWTQGTSIQDAMENAKEAAFLWFEAEQDKKSRQLGSQANEYALGYDTTTPIPLNS